MAGAEFSDWEQLADAVCEHFAALAINPRVVAVSGAQGSGKSTFAKILCQRLDQMSQALDFDRHCEVVSLDDYYLTKQLRRELARDVHPLLQTRGVPGTHDTNNLYQLLTQVQAGQRTHQVPRFDKGRDDREGYTQIVADQVILEGWCVGANPQPAILLDEPINDLEQDQDAQGSWRGWVNDQIAHHYVQLWAQVDFWIFLQIPSFAVVEQWRGQQEKQLSPNLRMSNEQLSEFIAHYQRLTEWQLKQNQKRPARPCAVVQLDDQHRVSAVQFHTLEETAG